ncbi:MAG: sugar ABC transporter permease [Gluconacetobacter diazotrophicus]|nr:sugar ABC transporter permease [Gluconacetobacter diazotrophicus]
MGRATTIGRAAEIRARLPRRRREAAIGALFVAPALFGFAVFYLWPIVRVFRFSLTNWNMLRAPRFVGFANYDRALHDPAFRHSALVTLEYVAANIPLQTALGLGIALLLETMRAPVLVRAAVLLPYVMSSVVVAMVWLWLLDPLLGVVDATLGMLGLPRQGFLADPRSAIVSIAGINIWRHSGFTALLFSAGLRAIPRELYEAAALAGAGPWTRFRTITLPLLRPVLAFVLVTSVIGSFQVFDTVAVTTGGGPADSSRVLVWYIYQTGFGFFRMGYASAMSVLLFAVLVAFTLGQMRLLRAGASELH